MTTQTMTKEEVRQRAAAPEPMRHEPITVSPRALPIQPANSGPATLGGIGPSLAAALAKAQQQCKPAPADKKNDHRNNWYSSAESIIQTAKEAMAGTGLSFVAIGQQMLDFQYVDEKRAEGNGQILCHFLLIHESGEVLPCQCVWAVVAHKGVSLRDALAIASTSSMSYMLRGVFQMPKGQRAKPAAGGGNVTGEQKAEPAAPTAGADQVARITAQIAEVKKLGMKEETLNNALMAYGVAKVEQLTAGQAEEWEKKLAKRIGELQAAAKKQPAKEQVTPASAGHAAGAK